MSQRSLVDFVTEVNGESHLRIEHDYGDGFVRLHTSEAERRQAAQDIRCSEDIVIELLRNARDAHAAHLFMAVSRDGDRRVVTVVDDGDGVPASMHETIFMPRVTSKLDSSHMDAWGLHGRGMALYSIAQNALDARVVASGVKLGTSMRVVTDTRKLPEKKDQSSFPRFLLDENGTVAVRGPKNILRTSCEFAIETRNDCSVYVGSPAEIAATLYAHGLSTLSAVDRAFCKDVDALPLAKRLAAASDPEDFAATAERMGLSLSPRTARRILDGEIDELDSLLDQVVIENGAPTQRPKRAKKRKLKVHRADADEFRDDVLQAFGKLAERYYLEGDVEPCVRVSSDKITVSIPLAERQEDL